MYKIVFKNKKLEILDQAAHAAFEEHVERWGPCTKCKIGNYAQSKVLVRGTLPADVLFVGEGPGSTENLTGVPFLGRGGKELDKWIEGAWHSNLGAPEYTDLTYAITNVVACRPCDSRTDKNRQPNFTEKDNCFPRAVEIFKIARPRLVVLLGRVAADWYQARHHELVNYEGSRWLDRFTLIHPSAVIRMTETEQIERRTAIVNDLKYVLKWVQNRVAEEKTPAVQVHDKEIHKK